MRYRCADGRRVGGDEVLCPSDDDYCAEKYRRSVIARSKFACNKQMRLFDDLRLRKKEPPAGGVGESRAPRWDVWRYLVCGKVEGKSEVRGKQAPYTGEVGNFYFCQVVVVFQALLMTQAATFRWL